MTAEQLPPDDDVAVVEDAPAGRFEIRVGDEPAGFLAYRAVGPSTYAVDHVEVDPARRGTGIAGRLVAEALDAARARGWQVLPYCSYVRVWLARNPSYADLVPAGERERFGLR